VALRQAALTVLLRYIVTEQFRILLLTLGALGGIHLAITGLDKLRTFTSHGASAGALLKYLMLELPLTIYQVLPFSLLMATVIGLGMLSGRSEITAMRAAGISVQRVVMPLLLVGLLASLLLWWAGIGMLPAAGAAAERVLVSVKPPGDGESPILAASEQVWFRTAEGAFYGIRSADLVEGILWGVRIVEMDGNGGVARMITADRMVWQDNFWFLEHGRVIRSTPEGLRLTPFEHTPSPLIRPPQALGEISVHPENLNSRRLSRYVERLAQDGYNALPYRVDLAARGAFPFLCFIMVLVAIPFGLTPPRSHSLARGVGICLVITVAFWMFYSLSLSLGRAGVLPALLSAWLPVASFAAWGSYRLLGIRQ